MKDLTVREVLVLGAMVAAIFYLGLSPQPVIDTARPALTKSLEAKAHYLLQQEKVDNKQNTCLVLDVFEVKQK
jgi:NADH-quinone oxidoreductase subunit M